MGVIVAAAGSLLGSYAGSKLMEKIDGPARTYGPDTKIPGVTSATIKPGNKKGDVPAEKIAQVDPTQALSWFREAAVEQENYYTKGLDYYQNALKLAAVEIKSGYDKSNAALQPMSFSANQALNEQMRMMGLDPISSSYNMRAQAAELGLSSNIQNMIASAESIKDPAERAKAKQQILGSIDGLRGQNQMSIKSLQDKISGIKNISYEPGIKFDDATIGAVNTQPGGFMPVISKAQYDAAKAAGFDPVSHGVNPNGTVNIGNPGAFNDYLDARSGLIAANDTENGKVKSDLQSQIEMLKLNTETFGQYSAAYNAAYADEYDDAYTGAEVEERVAATPGYQFQMDQGTKAIERQGAAKGMLGSGNTLTALTNYGQGLAQNFYGVYMDNLARIVAEGSPATMAIAANEANRGKDYGNLIAAGGQAGYDTHKAIGDAKATSLYNQGIMYTDVAKWNAGAQNQAINDAKNRESQQQNQATSSGASYMNANTAANQFNYGLFQNQQSGAAFAGTGASGWPRYDTKTGTWST